MAERGMQLGSTSNGGHNENEQGAARESGREGAGAQQGKVATLRYP